MNEPATVRLVVQDTLPRAPFDDFESLVGLPVKRIERPATVYAAFELFIPPLAAVVLGVGATAFAKSFGTEAGKGTWRLLEKGITTLAQRLLGPDGPSVTVVATPGKMPKKASYALQFSLIAHLEGGTPLRLVFVPGEDPAPAVARFFELLSDLHGPDRENVRVAGDGGHGRHGLFVRYDANTDALVLINPMAGTPMSPEEE